MSRNIDTSIYSLDGNSIWDIALKFERLGLQEMSKNSEVLFQGQVLNDSNIRDAINFKTTFDKFFSLYKEFHLKVAKGTQVLSNVINAEFEETFNVQVLRTKADDPSIQNSIDTYQQQFEKPTGNIGKNKLKIDGYLETIFKKVDAVKKKPADDNLTRYAKLGQIDKALEQMREITDSQIKPANYDRKIKQIEVNLRQSRKELKQLIMSELKKNPEAINTVDTNLNLRLATYEGTAMNVLRDLLITSNNIVQDIRMKRLIIQEALIKEESLGLSIIKDYAIINQLNNDLEGSSDVLKHYKEPYDKVLSNLTQIGVFSRELNKVLKVFPDDEELEEESEEESEEEEAESEEEEAESEEESEEEFDDE